MLDIAVAYNRFKFLGLEFLTWLWFSIDTDTGSPPETKNLSIGNRIVLENRQNNRIESLMIKGDDAGLEEGLLALRKGAVVTEINIVYTEGNNHKWQFLLKGEGLTIHQIKHPDIGTMESSEDLDAFLFEKTHHYQKILDLLDTLFSAFILLRLSEQWSTRVVSDMKRWISQS
ncbi:MAG: hypothetical protein R6U50_12835 [Desulfobacterales bacterium]